MEKKFYQLTSKKRIQSLISDGIINEEDGNYLLKTLDNNEIESFSENIIGTFSLPFSIIPDVLINGKRYFVPMSTEEPSVVAAAVNGIKRINNSGGFTAKMTEKLIAFQIVWETDNTKRIALELEKNSKYFSEYVKDARPSLIKRGGGFNNYKINIYDDYVELLIYINAVDAMGANIVNSISEYIAQKLDLILDEKHLIAILSNDGNSSVVNAKVEIKFDQLKTKELTGKEVAKKIQSLSDFTEISPFRASTNNKGILNGVFAVLQATGNDTRAESAAITSFLKKQLSLSKWSIDIDNQKLIGELSIPIIAGSVGGAVSGLPMAKIAMKVLDVNAKELSMIIASIGLANNLSAMRAIVTNGIQKGHMSLQSKSLAISAGAIGEEVEYIANKLNNIGKYDLNTAKIFIKELRNKK